MGFVIILTRLEKSAEHENTRPNIQKNIKSLFRQACTFIFAGPLIGVLFALLVQNRSHGADFDALGFLVFSLIAYFVGFVPAVMAACSFFLFQTVNERLFNHWVMRLFVAVFAGAAAGWIGAQVYLGAWPPQPLESFVVRESVAASVICAVWTTLRRNWQGVIQGQVSNL